MAAIISKETFDKFTEKEKEEVIELYKPLLQSKLKQKSSRHPEEEYDYGVVDGQLELFDDLFGKENLQLKSIKTWEDVEKEFPASRTLWSNIFTFVDNDSLRLKLILTYKIAKLIELGYGGVITSEEWENDEWKYVISCDKRELLKEKTCHKRMFIAFHTQEQRDEFMSYPENIDLVRYYFLT